MNHPTKRIISFDWAAKFILRDKANFDILEGLVSTVLDQPVHIVELLESESNQRFESDKFNRLDFKAKDDKGDLILIEIQLTRELYFIQRIIYAAAKTIIDHIGLSNHYSNVKKIYSINILYFDFGKGSDYLYHGWNSLTGVHTGDTLMVTKKEDDGFRIVGSGSIFPEYYLLRVNQFDSDGDSPLEQWMRYLKYGTIDENTTVPGLVPAAERLAYVKMSYKEQRAYDEYCYDMAYQNNVIAAYKLEGKTEGLAEGLAKGKAAGKAENSREIARKMKAMGMDIEVISEVTQLPAGEIKEL